MIHNLKHSFTADIQLFMQYYIGEVVAGLGRIPDETLDLLSQKLAGTIRDGRTIFAFGNGGSEAIAEHFIYALNNVVEGFKFHSCSNPKASELTDSSSCTSFDRTIKRQGRAGDLALLISASGNSVNINNVAIACREENVTSISLTGGGRIVSEQRSDIPVVSNIGDQQILEDVTQITIHLLTEITCLRLQNRDFAIDKIRNRHATDLKKSFTSIDSLYLSNMADGIINAFRRGSAVYVLAPDDGALSITASHVLHNLKWDAWSDIDFRLSNRVYSGFPTCHITGLSNDGAAGYVHAIDIQDNGTCGDIVILFARHMGSEKVRAVQMAAAINDCVVYPICFKSGNRWVDADAAQMLGHVMGRTVNTTLLLEQGDICREKFGKHLIENDLALLRQRKHIRKNLKRRYSAAKAPQKVRM